MSALAITSPQTPEQVVRSIMTLCPGAIAADAEWLAGHLRGAKIG